MVMRPRGMAPGIGTIRGLMAGAAAAAGLTLHAAAGFAGMGQPSPKQIKFQDAATPIAEQVHWFHDYVNAIIIAITLFVLVLLVYTMWRFSEKRNPVPSKTTHNTTIEVIWTVVPVLILVAIAIPSFRLLYNQYTYPPPDLVIKATGHTWNWTHEYPDQKVTIDSLMLQKGEIDDLVKTGFPERQAPRNLAVDNEILVPVNKVVHVLVTSSDVIHNWTVPSFGSKVDAVPGRVTATWFKAQREGIFFGQCSELCGKDHAFMPIAVRVVKEQVFNDWIAALKARDKRKVKEIIKAAAIELEGALKTADSGVTVKK
ncbi:MAG: cytochrome c oxidase subunit II [Hyphomicrobiaceae bacterium]|nr:cytochrome c oxidase subunit II [Hyphomicrobiaceae bacterium]